MKCLTADGKIRCLRRLKVISTTQETVSHQRLAREITLER